MTLDDEMMKGLKDGTIRASDSSGNDITEQFTVDVVDTERKHWPKMEIPRNFDREDLATATKNAKAKSPRITWQEAKKRAIAFFKASAGVQAYDQTADFTPIKSSAPKKRKPPKVQNPMRQGRWWKLTMIALHAKRTGKKNPLTEMVQGKIEADGTSTNEK